MIRYLRNGSLWLRSKTVGHLESRRALIWHDAIRLGALAVLTSGLFTVTLFCFRSFEDLESRLAHQWSQTGVAALKGQHSSEAVEALRTALHYEHDAGREREDQILLAEALIDDGRLDEARDYLVALWESTPGNGFLNLELGRIAHRQKDEQAAVDFYRAAIDGSWPESAMARRNEVRLELSHLLIAQGKSAEARKVLLVAAANAPDDPRFSRTVGAMLQVAGFPADAMTLFEKAAAQEAESNGN